MAIEKYLNRGGNDSFDWSLFAGDVYPIEKNQQNEYCGFY